MAFGQKPTVDLFKKFTSSSPPPSLSDPATDLTPPMLVRQRAIATDLTNDPRFQPTLHRQGAGLPPKPTISMDDCLTLMEQIINDPPISDSLRTIAFQGIARGIYQHALASTSSTRSKTLRDCANALRDISNDLTINVQLRRLVLHEILQLLYEH